MNFLSLARSESGIAMMYLRVRSLGLGCGKSAPRVAEQAFVTEISNFDHICTIARLIDCGLSQTNYPLNALADTSFG